mgnify:CR=1 FL=1
MWMREPKDTRPYIRANHLLNTIHGIKKFLAKDNRKATIPSYTRNIGDPNMSSSKNQWVDFDKLQ